MSRSMLLGLGVLFAMTALEAPARADCDCVSIAADVEGPAQSIAIRADHLYAAGDLEAAAKMYARGFEASQHPAFLYAEAQARAQIGQMKKARALLKAYVETGAEAGLGYRDRATAALSSLDGQVAGAAGAGASAATAVGGGVKGAGADVAGSLNSEAEPPRVAKGAAILLGVVAVAAIGAVGVQGISAGISDDVDFDTRFGLGMGVSGAVVGGTAIYLYGLTAASGTTGCLTDGATVITPVAHRGGAGAALATTF